MAKRGRRPDPPELKVLKANAKAVAVGPWAAIREAGGPEKPETVADDKVASRLWDDLTGTLSDRRILASSDVCILTCLCTAYSRMVNARRIIQQEGFTITNAESGATKAHPMLGVESGAAREVASYCASLGLTPSDRARITTIQDVSPPESKLSRFTD